jgi:SAM-dependent methyltransferase
VPFAKDKSGLNQIFSDDSNFLQLFPLSIRQLDKLHWSPLKVILKASRFLAEAKKARILDIGSGVGKFCLAGSYYQPGAYFYGVEQRLSLIQQARSVKIPHSGSKVSFIHKNFTQLDLKQFNGFYFYNSFFENMEGKDRIDDSIEYSPELYHYYSRYLFNQLDQMPTGTRIATYCSWDDEIPPSFHLESTHLGALLKFWTKV